MKHQHHTALIALASLTTAAALTGCGGGNNPNAPEVTVTVTPTVTAPPTSSTSKPAAPKVPASDDKGRKFDFGVVTKVSTVGSTAVLELDRWTYKGLDDAKLASQGVPIGPFKGKPPYENQNAKLTYTLPVSDGARILYHHCLAADQPLQTKSVGAKDLAGLADRENTVLVALDDQGRVTAAENLPGCPG